MDLVQFRGFASAFIAFGTTHSSEYPVTVHTPTPYQIRTHSRSLIRQSVYFRSIAGRRLLGDVLMPNDMAVVTAFY